MKHKRDWKKHPDLYDWIADPIRIEVDIILIRSLVNGNFGTPLETLDEIRYISSAYDKEYLEKIFLEQKITTGRNKPRNKMEKDLVKNKKKIIKKKK